MKVVLLSFVYLILECRAHVRDLKPQRSIDVQTSAVSDLIGRIIPQDKDKFFVIVDSCIGSSDKDTFQIEKLQNGTVKIVGTSGVAVASGFHLYLKYYCNCHISWEAVNLKLPENLPEIHITVTSQDRFRYYQNVCTTSYSFVWWNWQQWEKHIDWMALNSFNLVLALNGQEAIWKSVYRELGLNKEEIDEHFVGPAFLSWGRMGNLRRWGGPLSESWHNRSLKLQHQILNRMRDLGMIPVLPAFAGHVPQAFKRIFPNVSMVKASAWNRFNETYCCPYLLDPEEALFQTVGNMFMKELIKEFGTDHAYSCDTFNEMLPASGDPTYIKEIGQSVFKAMSTVDPQAVWIMQNWLFVHEFLFWTEKRAEALITSVPLGKMIVLDLQSEQHPEYQRLNSYYGQPYIWCMLHDFGGTLGMFGSPDTINKELFKAKLQPNSTLIGTGLTPEGINQNYVVYDFMTEIAWRRTPANLTEWFSQYAARRYGKTDDGVDKAWQILKNTVYNYTSLLPIRGKCAITRRPGTRIITWIWYNSCDLLQAWDNFVQSAPNFKESDAFLHDLVDLTRQVLQVLGDQYYNRIMNSFQKKDLPNFRNVADLFLDILLDMENILKTNEAFLLGKWLKLAKEAADNSEDEKLFEYNARNQITLWGPNGEIIDYANKQWSGMMSEFYLPRWYIFLESMNDSLSKNVPFKESDTITKIFVNVEVPFTFDRKVYPDTPSGDTVEVAQRIHKKWWLRQRCAVSETEREVTFEMEKELLKHLQFQDNDIL